MAGIALWSYEVLLMAQITNNAPRSDRFGGPPNNLYQTHTARPLNIMIFNTLGHAPLTGSYPL